ncbi:MAG: D-arabinono-1,4-lactone oxidase, partial [Actinomycetota bacterium]
GGDVVDCDATTEPDLFSLARHSLGAVGLVTELRLRVRDRYRLHERQWFAPPDEIMGDIDRLIAATRHFEFFWAPQRDLCACKSLDELPPDAEPDPADGPIAPVEQVAKRERRGWSHQIISSIRDARHTEMEYGVPAEAGPACFAEIRDLILDRFADLEWPVEYRTLAADDQLISVAAGRPTVTISVHQDITLDDRPLFEACEDVFRRHDGRPHWGKVHYRTGAELAALHAGYRRWWELRDRYDPDGVFVTADLAALRP